MLLLAFCVACATQAPPSPAPSGPVTPLQFQEVVQIDGVTKNQLYDAALAWFPSTFRSGKEVLQIQNKEAGMLVGTGSEPYTYSQQMLWVASLYTGRIVYRVTIDVKDGRYRFTVDGFVHESTTKGGIYSFGQLTTDRRIPATVGMGLTEDDRATMWAEIRRRATTLAAELGKSLKERLSAAATEKPW